MVFLLAPDSFKGSLDAINVCKALQKGIKKALPDSTVKLLPMADGGEGTLDILHFNIGGNFQTHETVDPLGRPIKAKVLWLNPTEVVIEYAAASGYELLKPTERNPLKVGGKGTGILIKEVLKQKPKKIWLTLGGSATVDGGLGLAKGIGIELTDTHGNQLEGFGADLQKVKNITTNNLPKAIQYGQTEITILTDVTNPIIGPTGAAAVFGPQKGANDTMITELEKGLENWVKTLTQQTQTDLFKTPGLGAAGGAALPLLVFCKAKLENGAQTIINLCKIESQLQSADIVITGEGQLDAQSDNGKAPVAIAQMAKKMGKKIIFIGGSIPLNYQSGNFDAVFSIINKPANLTYAQQNAATLIENTAYNVARLIKTQ